MSTNFPGVDIDAAHKGQTMKRDILEYAKLPDVPVSQLSPAERIIAGIAWMADNEGYGIKDAARKLIDDMRREYVQGDDSKDAERYRWLKKRYLGLDFEYGEKHESVILFRLGDGERFGMDLDGSIDQHFISGGE
jgi:hypothetical protein